METGSIKVLENVKINQNVICLIVSFIFLFYSKENCCCHSWIYVCSKWLFYISFISVCISSVAYVVEYCSKKCIKKKCYKLRYEYTKTHADKGTLKDACPEKIIKW